MKNYLIVAFSLFGLMWSFNAFADKKPADSECDTFPKTECYKVVVKPGGDYDVKKDPGVNKTEILD